jgi:hypothetical protein
MVSFRYSPLINPEVGYLFHPSSSFDVGLQPG